MKINLIALCIMMVLRQCLNSVLKLRRFGFHEYNIKNNWNTITDVTKTGPLQQIHLQQCIIAQQGLKKLLQEDLSKLRVLNISAPVTNPKVIKLLLSQPIIYQVDHLILSECNLQCEDFQILENKTSKITKLSLANNFISAKGLQYISRIKMNLTSFNFYANSLIHNKSIDSLIKIGLQQIKQLKIGRTSIQSDNLLRILENVNKQKLTKLSIRQNVYPATFYQKFTQLNFTTLEQLDLYGLIIDEDGFKYFQSFKLPSLTTLILHQNQLTTPVGKKIITKSNLPKLKNLDVNLNFLNSSFYLHLIQQNFVLEEFKTRIINMDLHGLTELSKMNLSHLKSLAYCHTITSPQIVQQFLKKTDLSNLQQLNFQGLINAGNLFKYLLKSNLSSLKYIRTTDIGDIDLTDLDAKNLFPSLLKANLRYYQNNHQVQKKLLQNIHILAPNLQQFTFIIFNEGYIINSLISGQINFRLTKPIVLSIYSQLGVMRMEKSAYEVLKIQLYPNQKPQIINLYIPKIYSSILDYIKSFKNQSINISVKNKQNFLQGINEIHFDFSQLQEIQEDENFTFFKKYVKAKGQSCKLEKLYRLQLLNVSNENVEIINKCKMPSLVEAHAQIPDKQKQIVFPTYPYLRALLPTITNFQQKESFIRFYEISRFEYIRYLDLKNLRITSFDMDRIINSMPHFNRIRTLNLQSSFLNKNISVIASTNLKLSWLSLGSILFSKGVFQQLCYANFQFMQNFNIDKSQVDGTLFKDLILCLQNKSQLVFPKLISIDLSYTYIDNRAIEALMQLHLPLINQLTLTQVKDPQVFNAIFKHPSSKRLINFFSYSNYLSSVDPNLDKKNTGRLQNFVLASESIRNTDLQALSKFDFDTIIRMTLILEKINDCKSLNNIRKIASNSKYIQISLEKSQGINSKCLQKIQNSNILPIQLYIAIEQPYGEARQFAEHFINPGQLINQLFIDGAHISDQKVLQISRTANLNKLQRLTLTSNNLSDVSIKSILGRQYKFLTILSVQGNQRITAESLSLMNGFVYDQLLYIDLSGTSIGDKGIEYLVRNQFPSLIKIRFNNADITREGISLLSKLKAPKLISLQISCNDLTADDIALLDTDKFPKITLVYVYPSLTQKEVQRLKVKFNRYRKKQLPKPQNQDNQPISADQLEDIGQTIDFGVTIVTTVIKQEIQTLYLDQQE